MKLSFNKTEKLKSKTLIDKLFTEGKSVSVFPLRLVYLPTTFCENIIAKTGVSVSKRQFKTAVHRNHIKRLMREAYRLNKVHYFNNITTQYAFMILYIGKEKPTFNKVENTMNSLFDRFKHQTSKNEK